MKTEITLLQNLVNNMLLFTIRENTAARVVNFLVVYSSGCHQYRSNCKRGGSFKILL